MSSSIVAPHAFRGSFDFDEEARTAHGSASGILARLPHAVAAPANSADLALLVRWAAHNGVPLVPRGAGTGMPGGNVGDGVAVDLMAGFSTFVEIEPELQRATVHPGMTLASLNAACEDAGLHLPVDPSSGARCTVGGMIANNSAGAHSVKYGAMRDWVTALDLVLADGSEVRVARGEPVEQPALSAILQRLVPHLQTHRSAILERWPDVRKNSSGYALREYLESGDLLDLIVGSEGTLALITSATVRLAPIPHCRGVALIELTSLEAAAEVILALLPLRPATCEILDRSLLEIVRDAGADADFPLRPGLEAILLVEMEGDSVGEVGAALRDVVAAVRPAASRVSLAVDPEQQERFWSVRHRASPLIAEQSRGRTSMQFIEDGVVPITALPEYIRLLRGTLARHEMPAVIFGHAGDGNLHVNPLVDTNSPGWADTLETILIEIAEGVARLGGTLAGEHGDGRLRAPLLETIRGAEMVAHFRTVKEAFDPGNILNPGVILPLPGQRPFDALRTFP
ncbi:MAG: FAD-binding oxidoreductase [Gemmatimonadetes bacterium]|nr:FAD-binding oxidoreductase [Gemmatimonadota bacterium]